MKNSLIRKPFRYSFFNATFILIGINVLFYLINETFPQSKTYTSLNVIYIIKYKFYWQFISYMFTHGNFSHILFNMLGLLFFGLTVERTIGSKEFTLFYLLSGMFCGIASFFIYWITGAYMNFLLGASGAVYAVLFMYAVLFPTSKIYIWGILPLQAPLLVAIYAAIEIVSQLMNVKTGIAHMTHLSGFLFAWLYMRIRMGIKPWEIWKNAYHQ